MLIESGRNINFALEQVPQEPEELIDLLANIEEELTTGDRDIDMWEAQSATAPYDIKKFRETISLVRLHPYPVLPINVLPKSIRTPYIHAARTGKVPRPLVVPTDLKDYKDETELIVDQRAATFVFRIENTSQTPYLMRCDEEMYFDEDNKVGEVIK